MPIVILVTGFLATLKTTVSQQLSMDLSIVCLNKDFIKEQLGDTIGFHNREENLKLSRGTFAVMHYMLVKHLEADTPIILESNFKAEELHLLKTTCEMHPNVRVVTVFLHGDIDALYQRYVKRQASRHPVHTSTGLLSHQDFLTAEKSYSMNDCFGHVLAVNTTSFSDHNYHQLVVDLRRWINPEGDVEDTCATGFKGKIDGEIPSQRSES